MKIQPGYGSGPPDTHEHPHASGCRLSYGAEIVPQKGKDVAGRKCTAGYFSITDETSAAP
jgi:hypothetical protein